LRTSLDQMLAWYLPGSRPAIEKAQGQQRVRRVRRVLRGLKALGLRRVPSGNDPRFASLRGVAGGLGRNLLIAARLVSARYLERKRIRTHLPNTGLDSPPPSGS
jgi:hypothetical protein